MDERTKAILERFDKSWSDTEDFYNDLIDNYPGFELLYPIKLFIEDLKKTGAATKFRLGTSMHVLVISRSVNFGLRPDQKHIKIEALENKFEVKLLDGSKTYRQYTVDNLGDDKVKNLLRTLEHTLAD